MENKLSENPEQIRDQQTKEQGNSSQKEKKTPPGNFPSHSFFGKKVPPASKRWQKFFLFFILFAVVSVLLVFILSLKSENGTGFPLVPALLFVLVSAVIAFFLTKPTQKPSYLGVFPQVASYFSFKTEESFRAFDLELTQNMEMHTCYQYPKGKRSQGALVTDKYVVLNKGSASPMVFPKRDLLLITGSSYKKQNEMINTLIFYTEKRRFVMDVDSMQEQQDGCLDMAIAAGCLSNGDDRAYRPLYASSVHQFAEEVKKATTKLYHIEPAYGLSGENTR